MMITPVSTVSNCHQHNSASSSSAGLLDGHTYNPIAKIGAAITTVNEYIDSIGGGIADRMIPYLAKGYDFLGDRYADVCEVVSEKLEFTGSWKKDKIRNTVKEFQYDPASTSTVLIVSHALEDISKQWAQRTPADEKWGILHFLDRASIGVAQSTFMYLKEANEILAMPDKLKSGLTFLTFETWIRAPRACLKPIWPLICKVGLLFKWVILFSVITTLQGIALLMPLFSIKKTQSLSATIKFFKKLVKHPERKIAEVAKNTLIQEENAVRKEIVKNIAKLAVKSTLSVAIPTAGKVGAAVPLYTQTLKPLATVGLDSDLIAEKVFQGTVSPATITDIGTDTAVLATANYFFPETITKKTMFAHNLYKLAKKGIKAFCPHPAASLTCDVVALGLGKYARPDLVTLKSIALLAGYELVAKPFLQSMGVEPYIDLATAGMTVHCAYNQIVKPILEPYYTSYNKSPDVTRSHLYDFCKDHAIAQFYPYIQVIRKIWSETPASS